MKSIVNLIAQDETSRFIQSIITWLAANPWFVVAGCFASIASLITGFIFYLRSLRHRKPRYSIRSFNLVRDAATKIGPIAVTFQGRPVKTVTVSKVVFWNAGAETIRREDVASADPMRISTESDSTEILDVEILQTTQTANAVAFTVTDGKEAKIDFDFLDQNHGAVFRILHTGVSSRNLSLRGTVKGARAIRREPGGPSTARLSLIISAASPGLMVFGSVFAAALLIGFGIRLFKEQYWWAGFLPLGMAAFYLFGGALVWTHRIPKVFKAFRELDK